MDTTFRNQIEISTGTQREGRFGLLSNRSGRNPLFYDIMMFLELGIYPKGARKKEHHSVRMMALQYIL